MLRCDSDTEDACFSTLLDVRQPKDGPNRSCTLVFVRVPSAEPTTLWFAGNGARAGEDALVRSASLAFLDALLMVLCCGITSGLGSSARRSGCASGIRLACAAPFLPALDLHLRRAGIRVLNKLPASGATMPNTKMPN